MADKKHSSKMINAHDKLFRETYSDKKNARSFLTSITLKFPGDIDAVMARVNKIDDLDTLVKITKAIKTAKDNSEIMALI